MGFMWIFLNGKSNPREGSYSTLEGRKVLHHAEREHSYKGESTFSFIGLFWFVWKVEL